MLGDMAEALLTAVFDALKRFVCWLLSWFYSLIDPWLGPLMDAIPDEIPGLEHFSSLATLFGVLDAWLPLSTGFQLVGLYYTIVAALVVVRWVLKFAPGFGGS